MFCSCGWKAGWARRLEWRTRIRSIYKCGIFFHDWEEESSIETGAIIENDDGTYTSEIDEGLGEVLGCIKQCRRCWKCISC